MRTVCVVVENAPRLSPAGSLRRCGGASPEPSREFAPAAVSGG